jgi:hypothetical protein
VLLCNDFDAWQTKSIILSNPVDYNQDILLGRCGKQEATTLWVLLKKTRGNRFVAMSSTHITLPKHVTNKFQR